MLEQLSTLIVEVGREILTWRGSRAAEGTWHGSQLKTEADLRAHAALCKQLNRHFPGIPVVSEEDDSSQSSTRPERYWLIDPIDGTASFSEGFPGYVTQVALIENEQPQYGAIYAPALELLYLAHLGSGATLNGRPLQVDANTGRCILIDNYPEPRVAAKLIMERLPCTGYVESGSIALKICRVADGTADLFVKDIPVRDWDIAPADLVLREAGGVLTGLRADNIDIVYRGGYERRGIVAATSAPLASAARAAILE